MKRRDVVRTMFIGAVSPKLFLNSSSISNISLSDFFIAEHKINPNENLWFDYPGRFWNSHAMHIGNGFLGLSFLGGIEEEVFGITEKSLWTGGPGENERYNYGIKPGGKDHLANIRSLILSNQINNLKLADELVKKHFLGDSTAYGHFSAFGRLTIAFDHASKNYIHYNRSLDISNAVSKIQYTIGDIAFKREYFCSFPDKVAVLKFSSSVNHQLSFKLKWDVFQKEHQISFSDKVFQLSGKVNGNNREFSLKIHLEYSSGKVYLQGDHLIIDKATEVIMTLSAATEYTPDAPLYKGCDPHAMTAMQIKKVNGRTFNELKKRHTDDYQKLYNRVRLTVQGNAKIEKQPTDKRWGNYAIEQTDPGLKVLYFNLSRYLLISSSRPGSLPANLQGGWNVVEAAQWSGNYQSNINVQLNYSSACKVNLLECQLPYLDWIKGLVKPGTEVARSYYNTGGWVSHSIGNIWGYTAPGFEIEWGLYPAGSAWHCHFIWQYFIYSQDKGYLKETGYPVMKGAALFWLENLIEYEGHLITAPSGSAEHGVYIENGQLLATGSSFDGDIINVPCNFQDIQMVYELFDNTIKAAELLGIDVEYKLKLKGALSRLMPLEVGQYGQLQEWKADVDNPECNHRHIGHLYGLWPDSRISSDKRLSTAARQTLNMRGEIRNYSNNPHKDIYTASNWSLGLRMACWLRLKDAERANRIFTQLITTAGFENLMTYQQVPAQDITVNDQQIFKVDERYWLPVWQIDASLAIAGFVAEMLLQINQEGILIFLPALPKEWPNGKIEGLKAPGNLTVDITWSNMKVSGYRVCSAIPVKVKLEIDQKVFEVLSTST